MATESFVYLDYVEAVVLHFELMHYVGEIRYGVFDRSLIESALARPQQAAAYENADLFAQAATLCFGLIKNHPWIGGNKRTATYLVEKFLRLNGYEFDAPLTEMLELVLAIESDKWELEQIAEWMRQHTKPFFREKTS
ncbi:MAG: type II toxin-antitoxin system death-on-curing family toxin [Blastocatellia bacterium]|nr:type II toxin-antitoxin system death-on-curing family toxin [Blastocatellia bacterium]